jgi:Tol biopolymer transport system component
MTKDRLGSQMAGEIFISYRRADVAWAKLLHDQLKAEGIEAWYDALVGPGQDWRIATAKALQTSRIFVLLFSENAAQSSDIAKELAAAVFEKKLIIPVRLQNIAPSGAFLYELASRNWVNAYDNIEAKLAELAKGLAQMVRSGAEDDSVLPFDRAKIDGTTTAPKRRRIAIIGAAAVGVIVAFAAGWLLWPARHWTVENNRPFLATAALESDPAFSANGATLAYSSGPEGGHHQIYLRNMAGGDSVKLTHDDYDDVSPTWSSDGASLAYVARQGGEPCRIMVASLPAGQAREVARCGRAGDSSVAWQPGTRVLYYADSEGANGSLILRLDLDSGAKQRIVAFEELETDISDLRCSPDGKMLLYIRQRPFAPVPIVIHDLASDRETRLGTLSSANGILGSATWSEDSKTVLASVPSNVGTKILAFPATGGASYLVYTASMPVAHLAAGSGGLLALESVTFQASLARAVPAPVAKPDNIDSSIGVILTPSFAPDGTLAFISNRTGTLGIWTIKPGGQPAKLADFGFERLVRASYSPDGTHLFAVTLSEDHKVLTMKILTADGATQTSFTVPGIGFGSPSWTPDGKAVLIFDRETLRAYRISIDDPAKLVPMAPPGWSVILHQGATYASRVDKPGLWRLDGIPKLIDANYPADFYPPITFLGDEVVVPDFNSPDGPRVLAQPLAGGPSRVLGYLPGAASTRVAISPVTGEIIYLTASGDRNIEMLTLAEH